MRPGVLPITPPLAPLRRITPSTLLAYRECPLRAVWSAAGQKPPLPTFAGAALGRTVHSAMESARREHVGSRNDFERVWERCVQNEEKVLVQSWTEAHLVPLSQSVRNYEQKKRIVLACSTGHKTLFYPEMAVVSSYLAPLWRRTLARDTRRGVCRPGWPYQQQGRRYRGH